MRMIPVVSTVGGPVSDTSLIGKAKELAVASQLVRMGVHVFMPLVDNGIDLIAASKDGKVFVPVQVKFKASRSGFALDGSKAHGYPPTTVLAFGADALSATEPEEFYFFNVVDWLAEAEKHATDREDRKLVVYNSRTDRDWLDERKGEDGLKLAFAAILEANART